jgi:hypothetical protein
MGITLSLCVDLHVIKLTTHVYRVVSLAAKPMIKAVLLILVFASAASAQMVRGIVLEDHTGAPVPAASIKLKSSNGTTLKEMDSERNGQFAFPDLPAGEYIVSIGKTNFVTVNARLTAQPDTGSLPVLRMIKYGVISGHMTSPRAGGTAVAIERVSEGQVPRSYTGMVNAAGEFRIFGIAPGRYHLAAALTAATLPEPIRGMALYPNNAQPREFVISGGEQFEGLQFFVPGTGNSYISGKVTGPGPSQPYSLTLVESDHPSFRLMAALTAMDGTFHFDNVLPGTYNLYASGPVTPPPSLFAQVHLVLNSQRVENMELVLKPGRTVEFAIDTNRRPVNSACSPDGTITLQTAGTWAMVRDQKLTAPIAPSSPAHFENVGPSRFNVTAKSTSGNCIGVTVATVDLSKDGTSEPATVVFQPPSSIRGMADAGSAVILRDVTPGREAIHAVFAAVASEFLFDGLAPGQYCITTQSAADTIPHWSPEAGCENPVVDLKPGESRRL